MPWLLLIPVAVVAVFGLLVWFASGINRVDRYRTETDRQMIRHIDRTYPTDSETGQHT